MQPLVSISCVTFNHASYIIECLDGFLMQKADFVFEVVIHDDASTDGTREIIEEYAEKYPDIFFPMYQDENQYSQGVRGMMARFNFPRCRGKYIALCEGDDYWIDPLKLQKQVDFLQSNPEYSYCGHKSSTNCKGIISKLPLEVKSFSFNELIFKNFLSTSSLFFRKSALENFPNFFYKIPAGDWAMQLIALKESKAYVLPDYMSVYRLHDKGVWNSLNHETMCEQGVKIQEIFKKIYNDKESIKLINKAIKERKKNFGLLELTYFQRMKIKVRYLFSSSKQLINSIYRISKR